MESLLDAIIKAIPVADVPELIVRNYLAGDDCLDDTTISQVFTTRYAKYGYTYLDENYLVPHSFDDQPCVRHRHKKWFRNGKLHRDNDLPAYKHADGTKKWYKNGKLHRDNDLPAFTIMFCREWYKEGLLHRDNDLPARDNGHWKQWFQNGKKHRDNDLPASILGPNYCAWHKDGKRHRDNHQPAVIQKLRKRVKHQWFVNGNEYSPHQE